MKFEILMITIVDKMHDKILLLMRSIIELRVLEIHSLDDKLSRFEKKCYYEPIVVLNES